MIPSHRPGKGQSLGEWEKDLETASQQDVDEITCYPTLITEYCIGYKLVREGRVVQPSRRTFKQMVYLAEDLLSSAGFEPVEIYGYSRGGGWKYATVNYEMEGPLLGFGCGAMGFTGGFEYQNTCSVPEYIKSVSKGELPIAGARLVDPKERAIRYATCRLFVCRRLDLADFERKFGREFEELMGRSRFDRALALLELAGRVKRRADRIELTRRGLFTAHQVCWAFVLNVPCRICEEFLKAPWPSEVRIP